MLTTKSKESRTSYGRTYWWSEAVKSSLDPARIRPPSQADGSNELLGPTTAKETQVTESENHPQWRKRRYGKFSGDIGGEFFTKRTWVEGHKPPVPTLLFVERTSQITGIITRTYRYGPILPVNPSTFGSNTFPNVNRSTNSVLDAWGAKAVAQCSPTNAVTDLSTFLGELLREGLPSLLGANFWKQQTHDAIHKKASKELLNWELGWEPIARDIGKSAAAIVQANKTISQFRRDSGKLVRRRFEFPPEESTSYSQVSGSAAAYLPSFSNGGYFDVGSNGRLIRTDHTVTRRWFSGAFTYYLPDSSNAFERMNEAALLARKTLGLSLTPDVVWNLAPWSWTVDWFTNAGDVLSNITEWAMYGLVLRYGYVMEHKISKRTYTLVDDTGLTKGFGGTTYVPAPLSYCCETKSRRKANPFGFGLTWSGLSPIQLAIAAALGITKLR